MWCYNIRKETSICKTIEKGVPDMTALTIILTLIAAYIVYSIYDARRDEALHQVNDFYQAEYKKSFSDQNEYTVMAWH